MKIVLGKHPTSFKKKIEFDLVGGDTGFLTVEFQYRTRTEVAKLMQEMAEIDDQDTMKLSEAIQQSVDEMAKSLVDILVGWDLDAEFNSQNVRQFCDEYPKGAQAIIEQYSTELIELRSGN